MKRAEKRQSVFVIALDGGMDAKQAAAVAMELVPNKMFGEA